MVLSMNKCRKTLALVWFIGSGLIFFILILQTMGGKYADHAKEAWQWFLPNVMPTLGLIVGVFAAETLGRTVQAQAANRFLFNLALALSVVYLLTILLPILALPFVTTEPLKMVAFLKQSDLWIRSSQGLVTAALGGFFVSSAAR